MSEEIQSWKRFVEYGNIVLLCMTAITLIAFQLMIGWSFLAWGIVTLGFCRAHFRKEIILIYISLGLLAVTEINTDISYRHIVEMGFTLLLAVLIPYIVSRFVYKEHLVRFQFHHGRYWYKTEIFYVFFTIVVSYFLLPFYLKNTGAYLNWSVPPGTENIIRFFIGTNALGIWDELFFVSTVLGILRRFLPFLVANLVQAVLFTSFLYELGFIGWGFIMIYCFAVLQGYIFRKTDSLFYIISIHLAIDLVLFLALVEAHHPDWFTFALF